MTIDTKSLRAIAEKATPGPWKLDEALWTDGGVKLKARSVGPVDIRSNFPSSEPDGRRANADAAFLVAASPDVVLAMIDELEYARSEMDRMRREIHALVLRRDSGCYDSVDASKADEP